jgi:predicted outer membrane protein
MSRSKIILTLAIAFAFPAVASAGPGTGDTKPVKKETKKTQSRLSEGDLSTLQHHHDVNQMEIEMGKLAQQKGGPEVKKYAAQLVKDHQTADKMAMQIAKTRAVSLSEHARPMTDVEEAEHQKQMDTMQRLKTLEGSNFDREYLSAMVDGHSAELGYMTVAIADATDAKLKAHLEKTRPVIERHADEARTLLSAIQGDEAKTPGQTTPGEMKKPDNTKPDTTKPSGTSDTTTPGRTTKPTPKTDETTPPKPVPYNPSR